jgi:hypothetical protein
MEAGGSFDTGTGFAKQIDIQQLKMMRKIRTDLM